VGFALKTLGQDGFDFKAKRHALQPGERLPGSVFFESRRNRNPSRFRFDFVDTGSQTQVSSAVKKDFTARSRKKPMFTAVGGIFRKDSVPSCSADLSDCLSPGS
jgi:hypothetical protein